MNEMNPHLSDTLVSGAADLLATAAWGCQLRSPQCLGGERWTLVQTTTMSGPKHLGSGLGWSKCKESKRSDTERSAHWQDFTDSEFRGKIYEHVNIFSHSFHRFCVICMPWKSLIYTDLVTSGFVAQQYRAEAHEVFLTTDSHQIGEASWFDLARFFCKQTRSTGVWERERMNQHRFLTSKTPWHILPYTIRKLHLFIDCAQKESVLHPVEGIVYVYICVFYVLFVYWHVIHLSVCNSSLD